MERYLRRLIRIGGSVAVVLPKHLMKEISSDYVWIEAKGSEIIIKEARVE